MARLLIIGSQEFAVEAIQFASRYGSRLSVLGLVNNSLDAVGEVRRARPDIIVVDGMTEGARTLECLRDVRAEAHEALLIVVVEDVMGAASTRALDSGAVVCARPTSTPNLIRPEHRDEGKVQRLRIAGGLAVDAPQTPIALTSRELETLGWVTEGHTNAWIARKLWVTEQTVKFHLTNIYRKLGVANRTEASRYAIRHGLVSGLGRDTQPAVPERPIDDRGSDARVIHG